MQILVILNSCSFYKGVDEIVKMLVQVVLPWHLLHNKIIVGDEKAYKCNELISVIVIVDDVYLFRF